MTRIMEMLQALKDGQTILKPNSLSPTEAEKILNWYTKYSATKMENIDLNSVIRLMYELYSKENICYHPVEVYCEEIERLSEVYLFDKTKFLDMHSDFLKMLLGDEDAR